MRGAVPSLSAAVVAGASALAATSPVRSGSNGVAGPSRLVRIAAIALLFALNMLVLASPTTACSGSLVPLSTAATSALRIVAGTVLERTATRPYELVLAVDRVVKGDSPSTIRISQLLDAHVCGDAIDAEPGQRLLVAFGVRSYGQILNPAAIFDRNGRLLFSWIEIPSEDWTVDDLITEMETLTALPQTDTAPPIMGPADVAAHPLADLFLAAMTALLLALIGPRRKLAL